MKLSIDELVAGKALAQRPHADHIYICGGQAVVVEETGRPEPRDVEKVRESMEMMKTLEECRGLRVVAGVVHYRRSDTMFNKIVTVEARRKPPVFPANCEKKLLRLLESLLSCTCRL